MMHRFKCGMFLSLVLMLVFVPRAHAASITVAVSSNFTLVLEALIEDFESLHANSKVVLVSGSSGKLYAQIKHGAPFDFFMSADQDKPLKLIDEGLAVPETLFTYALGSLVLWSADPKRIDKGEALLKNRAFTKLALANAKLAPYGVAAEQVLEKLGLENTSRSKWVQGENIAQTYQFVVTQNADLGFVAQSQVWKNGALASGSVWLIPAELYSPIHQDAVILKKAEANHLAKEFRRFLQTVDVMRKIESYGYQSQLMKLEQTTGGQF